MPTTVGSARRRPLIEHWDGTSWSETAAQPRGANFSESQRAHRAMFGPIWAVGQQGAGAGEPDDLIFNWTR